MNVLDVCKNYFNVVDDFSSNDLTQNVLGVVKVISYATLVFPLIFGALYCVACEFTLCGRVSIPSEESPLSKRVSAAKQLPITGSSSESGAARLSLQISLFPAVKAEAAASLEFARSERSDLGTIYKRTTLLIDELRVSDQKDRLQLELKSQTDNLRQAEEEAAVATTVVDHPRIYARDRVQEYEETASKKATLVETQRGVVAKAQKAFDEVDVKFSRISNKVSAFPDMSTWSLWGEDLFAKAQSAQQKAQDSQDIEEIKIFVLITTALAQSISAIKLLALVKEAEVALLGELVVVSRLESPNEASEVARPIYQRASEAKVELFEAAELVNGIITELRRKLVNLAGDQKSQLEKELTSLESLIGGVKALTTSLEDQARLRADQIDRDATAEIARRSRG
jgi:hypothetical protein